MGHGLTTGQIEVVADIADSRRVTNQAFELNGWMKGMSDAGLWRQEKPVRGCRYDCRWDIEGTRH